MRSTVIVPEDRVRFREQAVRAASAPFVRACCAIAAAKLSPGRSPADIARRQFGSDQSLDLIMRAATSPATIAGNPDLAQVATAFLSALVPASAGAALLARGIQLSFDGAASINVPGIAPPTGSFVAEGAPIPVRAATTSAGPTLTPCKLATITVLTGEVLQSSNAEVLVRQALIESVGPTLDSVLFSADAASADAPAGLLAGIAPLTATDAGSGQNKNQIIVDDLQLLAAALAPVSGNGNIVLIASPDAAVALALRLPRQIEWPLLTASLPEKTVIAVAAAAVVSAVDGLPEITANREVELVMNDVPADIVAGGTLGAPVMSTFQTDNVALRLRWPISWGLRDPRGLAWMQSVNW